MLLENYKTQGYLFNVNLTGKHNADDVYRGDLVLEFGELTERGDRKPPAVVAKQAVLYIAEDKIKLLITGLDQLADISMLIEHYGKDLADDALILLFVHDIKDPMDIFIDQHHYLAIPLDDGMIWNEALEVLCIEKSDLKGQSAEEKIATVLSELSGFRHNYPETGLDDALANTVEVKMTARGPV